MNEKKAKRSGGFSLLELLIALGTLLFGILMVLAVIISKANEENRIIEEHTATLIISSVAHALEIGFSTPLKTEYVSGLGPRIRVDHPGLFTGSDSDKPEGFAVIDLPGIPSDPMTLPEDLPVVRYPEEGSTYKLGEYLFTDEEQSAPGRAVTKTAARHIDVLAQYSFALKIKNWRGRFRLKVPSETDPDYEPYSKTPSAKRLLRFRPYDVRNNSGNPDDVLVTGGDTGYEVVVEVFRNYRPTSPQEVADGIENATLVARERLILNVELGFGSG